MRDRPSNPPRMIWLHPGKPLMIRWTVLKLFGLRVRFHTFLDSDPDDLHDHPWWFVTILLAGSYAEVTPYGRCIYKAPCILFRRANDRHRIEITDPVLTLVITGRKRRDWGFHLPGGQWVSWRRYRRSQGHV